MAQMSNTGPPQQQPRPLEAIGEDDEYEVCIKSCGINPTTVNRVWRLDYPTTFIGRWSP